MILTSFRHDLSRARVALGHERKSTSRKEVKVMRRKIDMIISRIIIKAAETTDKIISMLYWRVALYACDFSIRETDRG